MQLVLRPPDAIGNRSGGWLGHLLVLPLRDAM